MKPGCDAAPTTATTITGATTTTQTTGNGRGSKQASYIRILEVRLFVFVEGSCQEQMIFKNMALLSILLSDLNVCNSVYVVIENKIAQGDVNIFSHLTFF